MRRLAKEARTSLAESEDNDRAKFMVLVAIARCLLQRPSALEFADGPVAVRCDAIDCLEEELPEATELANFEATDEEVFLLWAKAAVAALRRRASFVLLANVCLEDVPLLACPSVEWRLVAMPLALVEGVRRF